MSNTRLIHMSDEWKSNVFFIVRYRWGLFGNGPQKPNRPCQKNWKITLNHWIFIEQSYLSGNGVKIHTLQFTLCILQMFQSLRTRSEPKVIFCLSVFCSVQAEMRESARQLIDLKFILGIRFNKLVCQNKAKVSALRLEQEESFRG